MQRAAVIFCLAAISATTLRGDELSRLQQRAIEQGSSPVAHWGWRPLKYTLWGSHSNRLIPVYTFGTRGAGRGVELADYMGARSVYRDRDALQKLYGQLPVATYNDEADYLDQTNIFDLQLAGLRRGKKHIFLVVFDGMDWETTRAAAIYNAADVTYQTGRGSGTHFQDYTANGTTEFGYMVTSPFSGAPAFDVNRQVVLKPSPILGGYDMARGGPNPWTSGSDPEYFVTRPAGAPHPHAYTDSASSATSMTAGIKTFNAAILVDPWGRPVTSIAHVAQSRGYGVGVVSSVPISHATPAAAYAHNVSRDDYQDLTRDMLGLPSVSHSEQPLTGLDVVIGGGYGVVRNQDAGQGTNFVPGNAFLTDEDRRAVDVEQGGNYVVAMRTKDEPGKRLLAEAAERAAQSESRLLGFFGVGAHKGHLPYATADGDYKPVPGRTKVAEEYTPADIEENPTLADMTTAAIEVLSGKEQFWLLVEAGDVDWANHDNNLDNSVGAVNSGDAAVQVITDWVEAHSDWEQSLLIVTADHGHYLVLARPDLLARPLQTSQR